MYDIYIKNFVNSSGTTVTTDTLVYSVPFMEGNLSVFTDPVVSGEMGKTGTFEFSMNPFNPYYSSLLQLVTIFRVEYDGINLFRGRVLTIDNSPLTGERKVHCEGSLAFLIDSQEEGKKDDDRQETDILTYMTAVINNHNSQVATGSDDKRIVLGEVPGKYSAAVSSAQRITVENSKFGSSSWRKSMDALSDLSNQYGGYFRIRYSGGVQYLDWLEGYFNGSNNQEIALGSNLIDISSTSEVDNIFTVVIPIGADNGADIFINDYRTDIHGNTNYIRVPQITSVYSREQLNSGYHSYDEYANAINKYGVIYTVQRFPNANTKEKLWSYVCDWIKNNYFGGITGFELTALDLRHTGADISKILVGDRITMRYPNPDAYNGSGAAPTITKTMTVIKATYNLHNPDKNSYSIGIPSSVINRTYGSPNSSKSSGGAKKDSSEIAAAGASFGGGLKQQTEEKEKTYDELAWTYTFVGMNDNKDAYDRAVKRYGEPAGTAMLRTGHLIIEDGLKLGDGTGNLFNASRFQSLAMGNGEIVLNQILPQEYIDSLPAEALPELAQNIRSIVFDGYFGDLSFFSKVELQGGIISQVAKTAAKIFRDPIGTYQQLFWEHLHELETDDPRISISELGGEGEINSMFSSVGEDGSGAKALIMNFGNAAQTIFKSGLSGAATISLDGKNSKQMFSDLTGSKTTAQIDGGWGSINSIIAGFGADGSGNNNAIQFDGLNGIEQLLSDQNGTPTISLDGFNAKQIFMDQLGSQITETFDGATGSVLGKFFGIGTDGTGTKNTVQTDGATGITQWLSSAAGAITAAVDGFNAKFFMGKKDGSSTTVEVNGDDGKQKIGKDNQGNWLVQLNDTITYEDESGRQQTKNGFVSASDFYLGTIPSFKTKLAVVDNLIADRVTVNTFNALKGRVETLEADSITTKNLKSQIASLDEVSAKGASLGYTTTGTLTVNSGSIKVGSSYSASWQSKSVVTDVTVDFTNKKVTPDTATIYYLGHT